MPVRRAGSGNAERDEEEAVAENVATQEEALKGVIGKPTGTSKVVVERGPVQHFASAVRSTSPIYHDPQAARDAGFEAIPTPPTWPFVMEFSGKFGEMQSGEAPSPHPLSTVLGPLLAAGGLLLHGEQEFIYHRPVLVGDVLVGEGSIVDAYQKESKGKTMTFLVSEMNWKDDVTGEPVVTVRNNLIVRA
jgi:N-terminal half of MaoC dehydratase